MIDLLRKTIISLRSDGLAKTVTRISWRIDYVRFRRRVLTLRSVEDRFTEIYKRNYWRGTASVSGPGSTLEDTASLRQQLPVLLETFSIESIFDAPCGDFYWMRVFLKGRQLRYIGGDIVAPLIETLNASDRSEMIEFIHIDLITDPFPHADLMISRDFLFHLSYIDTCAFLQNFVESGISYLLTTTQKAIQAPIKNRNIATGDYRPIDLFAPPYSFPRDACFRMDDRGNQSIVKSEMYLWKRTQIVTALKQFRVFLGQT